MSNKHHWSKFVWSDWLNDPALKICGLAAQGLWMRMLCVMHMANPIGYLVVNGRSPTDSQIASLCGVSADEVPQLLGELEANGVFSRTAKGKVIYNRRMVRDVVASEVGREHVAKRWSKSKPNSPPNSPPNGEAKPNPTRGAKAGPISPPTPDPITRVEVEVESELEERKGREDLNKTNSSLGDLGSARVIEAVDAAPAEPTANPNAVTNIVSIVGRKLKAPPIFREAAKVETQVGECLRKPGDELSEHDPPPAEVSIKPRHPVRSVEEMIAACLKDTTQSQVDKARAYTQRGQLHVASGATVLEPA